MTAHLTKVQFQADSAAASISKLSKAYSTASHTIIVILETELIKKSVFASIIGSRRRHCFKNNYKDSLNL